MQGYERADRQLLDAEMLAGHLVPPGSMFGSSKDKYETRRELIFG